jgi:hypothetical protein
VQVGCRGETCIVTVMIGAVAIRPYAGLMDHTGSEFGSLGGISAFVHPISVHPKTTFCLDWFAPSYINEQKVDVSLSVHRSPSSGRLQSSCCHLPFPQQRLGKQRLNAGLQAISGLLNSCEFHFCGDYHILPNRAKAGWLRLGFHLNKY